jgi:hypothetical protein
MAQAAYGAHRRTSPRDLNYRPIASSRFGCRQPLKHGTHNPLLLIPALATGIADLPSFVSTEK